MEWEYRSYSELGKELWTRLWVKVGDALSEFVRKRPKTAKEIVPGLKWKMTPVNGSESEGYVSLVMEKLPKEKQKRVTKNYDISLRDTTWLHVEGWWHQSLEDAVKSAVAWLLALPIEYNWVVEDRTAAHALLE